MAALQLSGLKLQNQIWKYPGKPDSKISEKNRINTCFHHGRQVFLSPIKSLKQSIQTFLNIQLTNVDQRGILHEVTAVNSIGRFSYGRNHGKNNRF